MAKKSMIQRQKKRVLIVQKYRFKRGHLKYLIKGFPVIGQKYFLYKKLQELPRDSAKCRLRNRCSMSGRPRAYCRDFGLSRHFLRSMGHQGLIPGLTKSSW